MKLVVGQDDLISHPTELVDEWGAVQQNKEGKGKGFSLSSFFCIFVVSTGSQEGSWSQWSRDSNLQHTEVE